MDSGKRGLVEVVGTGRHKNGGRGSLEGRVVVVTGAAGGIGSACCREVLAQGAYVVAGDLAAGWTGGQMVSESVRGPEPTRFVYQKTDVRIYDDVQQLVGLAATTFGRVDVMVNNAGVETRGEPVDELTVEEYRRVLSVNQDGCFFGIRAAAEKMRVQRSGVIVNTASVYGLVASRGEFAYCASKASVIMMTKAAAVDLGRYGVRVVGVAPGLVDTDMVANRKGSPDVWSAMLRAHMRRRAAEPAEVGKVIAFLASDDASFINGQVVPVDDGCISFR
ncbi:MAG: SDR family NAD(P)-dependent oxidoreductase [Candidatus Dormibacteria bacterium]